LSKICTMVSRNRVYFSGIRAMLRLRGLRETPLNAV